MSRVLVSERQSEGANARQGAGKTSLVQRYVNGTFTPSATVSTLGASFLTKRTVDADTGIPVRLQLWDTAGQEKFRSITKLYYRGASAIILVYSITSEASFLDMASWLEEVRQNLPEDVVLHVVGTKSDVVAQDPEARQVGFDRCIAYVAENLMPLPETSHSRTESVTVKERRKSNSTLTTLMMAGSPSTSGADSKRQSGFGWGHELGWDAAHEISASSGEGIEEVFRVVTRKLVEQHLKKVEQEAAVSSAVAPGVESAHGGYFDGRTTSASGSMRLGTADKRRSWLGSLQAPTITFAGEVQYDRSDADETKTLGGRCYC